MLPSCWVKACDEQPIGPATDLRPGRFDGKSMSSIGGLVLILEEPTSRASLARRGPYRTPAAAFSRLPRLPCLTF